MYQQVTLVGNLGQDPELRYTPSGAAVTNLSVATNKKYTTNAGEYRDETTWWRVAVWVNQAEACAKYLAKGRQVLVIGEVLEPRVWQDKQGVSRASLEVKAIMVKFLAGGGDDSPDVRQEAAYVPSGTEEDIPF